MAKLFPTVPVRYGEVWRVWRVPRSVVGIITRDQLELEVRTVDAGRCIEVTGRRSAWLKLHLAITLELQLEPPNRLVAAALRRFRERLHHLVAYHPTLGDPPS